MKIPKTLPVKCLCGGQQTVPLTLDEYEATPANVGGCDFVYCTSCKMPIAFGLPAGLARRNPDRYAMLTIAQPLRLAS